MPSCTSLGHYRYKSSCLCTHSIEVSVQLYTKSLVMLEIDEACQVNAERRAGQHTAKETHIPDKHDTWQSLQHHYA